MLQVCVSVEVSVRGVAAVSGRHSDGGCSCGSCPSTVVHCQCLSVPTAARLYCCTRATRPGVTASRRFTTTASVCDRFCHFVLMTIEIACLELLFSQPSL